jgi:glycosyltransferase involved in cell wall biosynthesis
MNDLTMPTRTRVIHIAPTLHPSAGGPARVVVDLTSALAAKEELCVLLVSQGLPGEPALRPRALEVQERLIVTPSRTALRGGWPVRRELAHMPAQDVQSAPRVLHAHGLWTASTHWAVSWARRTGTPLLIQPHGMLHPWALQHKLYKKKLAMALFQARDLQAADVLVATSLAEYEYIRSNGLKQPVALIPNGIELPSAAARQRSAAEPRHTRTALFLSRIHPVKGLVNLVRAWAQVRPCGWRLVVAGPNEDGHLADVMKIVREERLGECLHFVGEVDASGKTVLFNEADLFILPTFSENFGVVVAEALSYGVPVITTQGAPWSDLLTHGCGWWVAVGVDPLASALRSATSSPAQVLTAMGRRGRDYVTRYEWNSIASELAGVYRWMLGTGAQPASLLTA